MEHSLMDKALDCRARFVRIYLSNYASKGFGEWKRPQLNIAQHHTPVALPFD
jgi:hypothetical protein